MIEQRHQGPPALVHVIDDDPDIRWALDLLLKASDFDVQSWSSGRTFLNEADLSNQDRPTCILTDVKMPDLDGLALLSSMRTLGVTLPVIVMTGEADVPTAVQAMKMGAFDFIEKPFESSRLIELIDNALKSDMMPALAQRKDVEESIASASALTSRERDVLQLAIQGKPNKIIAYELNLSQRTVELYRSRALRRLSVRSIAEAARVLTLAGLGQ